MGEDRLRKFVHHQLARHQTPVDGAATWQKIQAKQRKRRRRVLFWWWSFGFASLGVLMLLYLCLDPNKSNTSAILTEELENIKNSQIDRPEDFCLEETSVPDDSIFFQTYRDEEKVVSTLTIFSNDKDPIKPKISRNRNTPIQLRIDEQIPVTISEESENNLLPNANRVLSNILVKSSKEQTREKVMRVLPLRKIWVHQLFNQRLEQRLENTQPSITNSVSDKSWKTSLASQIYYGINGRRLRDQGNAASYKSLRADQEETLDVQRFGIDIRWKHKKGFYGKVGIDLQQITERFSLERMISNTYLADDQLIAVQSYIDGRTENIYGPAPVTDLFITRKTVYNKYHSIEVPVYLGYETKGNRKLQLFGEVGVGATIFSNIEGEILDANQASYSLNQDTNDWFVNNFGLTMQTNLGLNYHFNQKWALQLSPSFKYYFKDFATTTNPLSQTYFTIGLQLGVRYHLN